MTKRWILAMCWPFLALGAQPNQLPVRFDFVGDAPVAVKTVAQGFSAAGYRLDIGSISVEAEHGSVEGTVVGLRPFTPEMLGENLRETGVEISSMALKQGALQFSADVRHGIWNVPYLGSDEGIELQKTAQSQWFRIEEGQTVRIEAPYAGRWYPDIAVLDGAMDLVSSIRSDKVSEETELELPSGARYLKISNLNGMKVMPAGMWIESLSPGR